MLRPSLLEEIAVMWEGLFISETNRDNRINIIFHVCEPWRRIFKFRR